MKDNYPRQKEGLAGRNEEEKIIKHVGKSKEVLTNNNNVQFIVTRQNKKKCNMHNRKVV